MQTLRALFDFARPINGLITALSVAVGGLCAQGPLTDAVLLAALSAVWINAAGNAFNDLIDVDIDLINRPQRPLPAGRITLRTAAFLRPFALLLALV